VLTIGWGSGDRFVFPSTVPPCRVVLASARIGKLADGGNDTWPLTCPCYDYTRLLKLGRVPDTGGRLDR